MGRLSDLDEAKRVLEVEARCLLATRDRLNGDFTKAVKLIVEAVRKGGKVAVSGVGKSGKIAAKVAATLSSTGTPAIFLHPTEASHGDLGIVASGDVVLLLSYSGASDEVLRLLPSLKNRGAKLVSIVGNMKSTLALSSDVAIDGSVELEACPMNLAPTSSTTVALALGDALAVVLSLNLEFKEADFAVNHPGGALGRRLTLKVRDLMKSGDELAWVETGAGMDEVVDVSTSKKLGAVLVRDGSGNFVGIITDGDLRRALRHKQKFFTLRASDVMTANPIAVSPEDKAIHALELMENRPSQISVLPVVAEPKSTGASDPRNCVGLVRLHDLIGRL